MRRAPSALLLVGGFGVAVAVLSVATTAAVVLLAPQPPALRMSAAAAITALSEDMPGYARRVASAPPDGARAAMLEQMIAAELRRSPADVRAVWIDGVLPREGSPLHNSRIRIPAGVLSPRTGTGSSRSAAFVLLGRSNGSFQMVAAPAATAAIRRTFIGLPMPAFIASVRGSDGRWLIVRPVEPLLSGWRRNVLIALALSLLLLLPLAWLFARRLTRPFRALAGALANTADAVPEQGPRELREAAAAIAAMRTRLAAEAAERARMLTAIAHDLRTPLTGLRLRIEASPEPQRARMVADVERMQAMIGEVLSFARHAALPNELVEVRHVLAETVADMGESAATIRIAPGDDVQVAVPASAFRRVIENLLRNAIDYAGGGTIEARRNNDDVIISVTDDGPGIPAVDRERLLRPFERGDTSRNRGTGGAGLGLSIVREFAAQHRGEFTLADSAQTGTTAALRLPAA
jgi:signal transduction histidine kinase